MVITRQAILTPLPLQNWLPHTALRYIRSSLVKKGLVPYGKDFFGRPNMIENTVDETTMRKIAEIGGGEFFRATDNQALSQVFARIDQFEKAEIKETRFKDTSDYYFIYVQWAIVILPMLAFSEIHICQQCPSGLSLCIHDQWGIFSGKRISLPAKRISRIPRTMFMKRINRGVISSLSLSANFALIKSVENTVPTMDAKKDDNFLRRSISQLSCRNAHGSDPEKENHWTKPVNDKSL